MKKQNGITLIALVITIVVLLILAGVSIAMVLGDNGILNKAKSSQTAMDDATVRENIANAITYVEMEALTTSDTVDSTWYTSTDAKKGSGLFAEDIARTNELTNGVLVGYKKETGKVSYCGTVTKGGNTVYFISENGKITLGDATKTGDFKTTYDNIKKVGE